MSVGVSCNEKKLIVDLHNKLRKTVANGELDGQPGASNMQKIIWDDKLQASAQNWVDKKLLSHTETHDPRFSVGQNIHITSTVDLSTTAFDWSTAIMTWFNEHKSYGYKPIKVDLKSVNYTQIVWAKTMYVGCGAVQFKSGEWIKKLYLCYYGPGGNTLGEFPYTKGSGNCQNLCCTNRDCSKLYGDTCQ